MLVRKLDVPDLSAAWALGTEAFGQWPTGTPLPPTPTGPVPGLHRWGAFDDDRLVTEVAANEYHSWWRGRQVATCGISSVAVAAEHRGAGLLVRVLGAVLAEAVERGEVLSTLYPTANGIYRGLGYELITSYDTVEVPTAELGRIRMPDGVRTRRATVADQPAMKAVYAAWAAAQNGPLTRTGLRFHASDAELHDRSTGTTLALDDAGAVTGFVSWSRGEGYGHDAVLTVRDLLATDAASYRALWHVVGSFASVTGTVRLTTSGDDPARLVLPSMTWHVVKRNPYMLRVLDLPGAVAGDRLGVLDGGYRLTLSSQPARCELVAVGGGVPTLTPQGLALLLSGAQSCANLRLLSHLSGPAEHDDVLEQAFGGRQVHVRDYF